jgi:hypothetical protein
MSLSLIIVNKERNMRKLLLRHGLVASALLFVVSIVAPVGLQTVSAEDTKTAVQERKETAQATIEEKKEAAKAKLADAKLRVCQKREQSIKNIMTRISDRGQKHIDLFNTIAERTEKFYTDKGRTVANYDALVADVNAKKATAQTAVDDVKAKSGVFTCTADDPKGAATAFKDSLKAEIAAMKAYKTSVKNLIVAVKSAQSDADKTKSTEGEQS